MKKALAAICAILLLLCGCSAVYYGDEGILSYARTQLPVSGADTIDLSLAGSAYQDDLRLAWFITGNEYQAHTYVPIEFQVVSEDGYTPVHTYKPMDRGADISVLSWNRRYCFLVNNPDCAAIELTDSAGGKELIEVEYLPYVYYAEGIPASYRFLKSDGSEIY